MATIRFGRAGESSVRLGRSNAFHLDVAGLFQAKSQTIILYNNFHWITKGRMSLNPKFCTCCDAHIQQSPADAVAVPSAVYRLNPCPLSLVEVIKGYQSRLHGFSLLFSPDTRSGYILMPPVFSAALSEPPIPHGERQFDLLLVRIRPLGIAGSGRGRPDNWSMRHRRKPFQTKNAGSNAIRPRLPRPQLPEPVTYPSGGSLNGNMLVYYA